MQKVSRLINSFVPENYNLSLTIDRPARKFHGIVTVKGSSLSGGAFRFHAKDLKIESVTIDGRQGKWTEHEDDELEINRDGLIAEGHIIVIAFYGLISDQMHGMYPCYFNVNGEKKELLATQFESHHAREVFPCIDEPEAKATFDVTLTTEKAITILGNMPIASQVIESELLVTNFETTPRMSVYLLAWVLGNLHKKSAKTKTGVEVNVWATTAQKPESLDFALEFATKTIDYYEDYFGVNYPLPKSDHVALPDFTSGAMENWGLITYREIALLADPATSTVDSRHYIAMVVGHELSHQWFGNLVTMKWWDNLWLNESFANFIENLPIHDMHPDWGIWMEYASTWSLMALRRDAIEGVQPVQIDVNHPDEITSLFDGAIVYGKGGRLIGMLRQYIGEADFKNGLKNYFTKFQYKNTTGGDLWDCLEEASGKPIRNFMNAWVLRPGYPVVHVKPDSIEQEQFFIGDHQPSDKLWPIPLAASPGSDLPEIFDTKEMSATITHDTRLNIGNWSHFVTNYTQDHFDHLLESLQDFSPLDRLQLINERVLLTRSSHVPNSTLIALLHKTSLESNESVWSILGLALGELKKFVEDNDEARKNLKKLAAKVAQPQYDRLGWNDKEKESENDIKLRPIILGMKLYAEDENVLREAVARFKATSSIDSLDPELRSVILAGFVKAGIDQATFDRWLGLYVDSSSASIREDIIGALSGTKNLDQIRQLLEKISDSNVVRPQDASHLFVYLIRNRYAKDQTWAWLRANWDWIEKTYGGDKSFDDFARYSAGSLSTKKQLDEYIKFFTPLRKDLALLRVIDIGISEIRARVDLIESQKDDVVNALAKARSDQ